MALRTKTDYPSADGEGFCAGGRQPFHAANVHELGRNVPKEPPFLPAGWKGSPSKPPYPEYIHPINTTMPQAFPAPGDLAKPWAFGGKTFTP
jgi:sulfonate transport system substrate-binding protein